MNIRLRLAAMIVVTTFTSLFAQDRNERQDQWQQLVRAGAPALPDILEQLNQANPVTANYLRTSFETIAEKELAAGRSLNKTMLETFMRNQENNARARRLAYEWLVKVDPEAKSRWLGQFMNDPSLELRRDAVADALAKLPKDVHRRAGLKQILISARDKDQVDAIAKELKELGVEVDIAGHFGFIREWAVLSTFDNTDGKGFATPFPPEEKLPWDALPSGKAGKPTVWKRVTTTKPDGKIDLNKELGKQKASVAYAVFLFKADQNAKIDVRASSMNALKIWLNGKPVVAHEEYHHGDPMDQYIGKGDMRAGDNQLVVKICQNDQPEMWAQSWGFALRLCDHVGTPIQLILPVAPPLSDSKGK